jgi:hypothetical protein
VARQQPTCDIFASTLLRRGQLSALPPGGVSRIRTRAKRLRHQITTPVTDSAEPGSPTAHTAKDAALLSLGSDLRLANNVSFGLKFDSEVAWASRSFAVQGIVRYGW